MISSAARALINVQIMNFLKGDVESLTRARGQGFGEVLKTVNRQLATRGLAPITSADLQALGDELHARGKAAIKAQGGPGGAAGIHKVAVGPAAPHAGGPIALRAAHSPTAAPKMNTMAAFLHFEKLNNDFDMNEANLRHRIEPHTTYSLLMDVEHKRFKDFASQARVYLSGQVSAQTAGGNVDTVGITTTLARVEALASHCMREISKLYVSKNNHEIEMLPFRRGS